MVNAKDVRWNNQKPYSKFLLCIKNILLRKLKKQLNSVACISGGYRKGELVAMVSDENCSERVLKECAP